METARFSKQETFHIQKMLKEAGHTIVVDEIWGPQTAAAYDKYLASEPEDPVIVTPNPAKPWWQSKAQVGTIVTLVVAVAALAGHSLDAVSLTEAAFSLITLFSGLLGFYGNIKRDAPIDSDLLAPNARFSDLTSK